MKIEKDEKATLKPVGSGVNRSKGLHLSNVIHDIANALGMNPKGADWDLNTCCEVGFLWEDVLSEVFGNRMGKRISEVELLGISGSPDGIAYENGELILEEYKCTWRSVRNCPSDNWKWMTQIKAYCWMLSKQMKTPCTKVRMRILYINGMYKPPSPIYSEYVIRFTVQELSDNWDMIMNHAKSKGWIK